MSDDERVSNEADSPLSDESLLDLLDALVESKGRVAAAETLGVNYRTMMACYESRRVSRRMRRALREFRGRAADDGGGAVRQAEALGERVAELEEENRELRELVEAQASQLEEAARQMAALEAGEQPEGEAERVESEDGHEPGQPRRGKPEPQDTMVVALEKQQGEDEALGPAGALVEEWRELRAARRGSRVKRAEAAVRRWELEVELLRDFHLTLQPETEPLDDSRRDDHVRWRLEALAEARRELGRAVRVRWLRRAVTLGVWWR